MSACFFILQSWVWGVLRSFYVELFLLIVENDLRPSNWVKIYLE